MPLNPLSKLRRFSSAKPAPNADVPKALPAAKEAMRAPLASVPPLTQEQLIALANPLASNCKECKRKHTTQNFVMFATGGGLDGWYCFECWAHFIKNKRFPIVAPRAVPVKVTRE